MKRRMTLLILGTVAATLLLAGVGTLVLARIGARRQTEDDLRSQSEKVASALTDIDNPTTLRAVTRLGRALDVDGIEVMRFGPGGRTVDTYPDGVSASDIDLPALQAGQTVSGAHGSLVYAVAPAQLDVNLPRRGNQEILAAVVLTRHADPLLGPATRWFIVVAIITLAIGALVAWRFGRRLAAPMQHAEEAARRITDGDLSARVPVPSHRDELQSLVGSINTMAETLERSHGLEQQFLLSVSHDLRTPLTSIRGYAEAIADGTVADPADGAAVILSEARRLERLVRDLLDLAKLEAHEFSLAIEPVDLVDVAAGTADGFRPEADDAQVAIDVTDPVDPVVVSGDPDRLAQVAANLIENALKFAESSIRIVVTGNDTWARLDVIDDGRGIAPEDLPHVFERLYVARHQPRRQEAGSGLGLAIVRELVTAMNGHVEATAWPAGGTCLSVLLPRVLSAAASTTTNSTTTTTNSTTNSTTEGAAAEPG
jgi:two-component system sensor histidine kinase BaeS